MEFLVLEFETPKTVANVERIFFSHQVEFVVRLGLDVVVRERRHLEELIGKAEVSRKFLIPETGNTFYKYYQHLHISVLLLGFRQY